MLKGGKVRTIGLQMLLEVEEVGPGDQEGEGVGGLAVATDVEGVEGVEGGRLGVTAALLALRVMEAKTHQIVAPGLVRVESISLSLLSVTMVRVSLFLSCASFTMEIHRHS